LVTLEMGLVIFPRLASNFIPSYLNLPSH
jgi:hypothetical protein